MTNLVKAYAALKPNEKLQAFSIERRNPKEDDVLIKILYCGICHSDIHQVNDDWGGGIFPMVPGHEIVGVVEEVGSHVSRFKIGDKVGVGCFVDSCRTCDNCKNSLEQYCHERRTSTYNDLERDGITPTYGGYSQKIVVNENYVLHIPNHLPLDKVAPLLCAGITTYSPMRHWNIKKGKKVGIIGLGGLGHMAVKIGHHLGGNITVFSHSENKSSDSFKFGADEFINTKDPEFISKLKSDFDLIIHTSSNLNQISEFLSLLKLDGTLVIIGLPRDASLVDTKQLIFQRRNLSGSLIGGIKETQEMLDFCGKHHISAEIELINIKDVNRAYQKVIESDVRYRYVIDMSSLSANE